MRDTMVSGFYCRHDACTKKFVNKLSRSRHEAACQYRKQTKMKAKKPTKVLKPAFDETSKLYKCVDPKVKSKYQDVIFGRPINKKNTQAIIIKDHPKVLPKCYSEPSIASSSSGIDSDVKTTPDYNLSSDESQITTEPMRRPRSCDDDDDDDNESVSTVAQMNSLMPDIDVTNLSLENEEEENSQGRENEDDEKNKSDEHVCNVCRNCTKRENDLFCASLAETLDRLDWRKQRIAKIKFQEILYDLEYDRLDDYSISNA